MSGDNQHFIPRHYLKGFKILGIGGGKKAWVFRQDAPPEMKYIKDIAADEHFYSPPAPGSLDDVITKYENRLAAHFEMLRSAPFGPFADAAVAAEVISHLTVRTESMRKAFAAGAKQMALSMFQTFRSEDAIRRLMDLEGGGPGTVLKKLVDEMADKHATELQAKGLPREALHRLALTFAKERLPDIISKTQPMLAAVASRIYGTADDMVADAQRKALEKSLVPEERVVFLSSLNWEIVATEDPAVLSDCVSIAVHADGKPRPLILSDKNDIRAVIFPLGAKRLLIGRLTADAEVRPALYNIHALSCAETFFVSSVRNEKLEEWAQYIGVVSKSTMLEQLSDVFAEYQPKDRAPVSLAGTSASFPLSFPVGSDETIRKSIHEKVHVTVSWVMSQLSLDRINGISFADNVPERIAEIRQTAGLAVEQVPPGLFAGTILMLKDNAVGAHIVLHSRIGLALLDETKPEWLAATYYLVKELAESNAQISFDTAFPGVMLRPHASLFNLLRYEQVAKAWSGYLSSRFAGQVWVGELDDRRNAISATIDNLKAALPGIGERLRATGDRDAVLREVLPFVQGLLIHTSVLAGLLDAAEHDILADAPVMDLYRGVNLADWLRSYVRDLRKIWDDRGQWSSLERFIALGRHTERILQQCGIVLSETADGQCRVDFPAVAPPPTLK